MTYGLNKQDLIKPFASFVQVNNSARQKQQQKAVKGKQTQLLVFKDHNNTQDSTDNPTSVSIS